MLVSETMAMKVMVAGDVEGSLTTLFKRVEAVDKKAGKCVFPPWSSSEKCVSLLVLF